MKNNKIFQILGLAIALFILALMLPNTKQTDASSTSVASLEEAITLNELKTSVVVVSEEKKEVTKPAEVVIKKTAKKIKVITQAKPAVGVMEIETKPIVKEKILLTKMPVLTISELANKFDSSSDLMKVQIENIELYKEITFLEAELVKTEKLLMDSAENLKETLSLLEKSNEAYVEFKLAESEKVSLDSVVEEEAEEVTTIFASAKEVVIETPEVANVLAGVIENENKPAEIEALVISEVEVKNKVEEIVDVPTQKVVNLDTFSSGMNVVIIESFSLKEIAQVNATQVLANAVPEIKIEKKQIVLERLTLAKQNNLLFIAYDDSCALDEMRFVELTKADSLDEGGRYALGHKELFKKNGKKIEGKPYTECHQLGKYYPDKPENERWIPIPWNYSRTSGTLGDTISKKEENKTDKKVLNE